MVVFGHSVSVCGVGRDLLVCAYLPALHLLTGPSTQVIDLCVHNMTMGQPVMALLERIC